MGILCKPISIINAQIYGFITHASIFTTTESIIWGKIDERLWWHYEFTISEPTGFVNSTVTILFLGRGENEEDIADNIPEDGEV